MQCVKTRQQIADEYGIHRTTFNRWLKRANMELPHGLINPSTVQEIYKAFGYPLVSTPTQPSTR